MTELKFNEQQITTSKIWVSDTITAEGNFAIEIVLNSSEQTNIIVETTISEKKWDIIYNKVNTDYFQRTIYAIAGTKYRVKCNVEPISASYV